jgi:hypothetical protein
VEGATEGFVIEKVGLDMRSANSALCWVVRPEHLRTAPLGSSLRRLHELVQSHRLYGHIEHSFIATASREEIVSAQSGAGKYMPLYLHTEDDEVKRTQLLRSAITVALAGTETSNQGNFIEVLNLVVSAADIVKDVFF